MNLLDRAVSLALPVVPKPIVGFFSRHYIAGTTVDDALRVVHELLDEGAMTTLDILGESVAKPEEAVRNTAAYEELIDRIHGERLRDTHVSVKLTALGLSIDHDLCLANVRKVLERIRSVGSYLRIDMEDSSCTTPTLSIYETLREERPDHVGIVLQSCLRRTVDDVDRLAARPANFRLCKGIYVEPRRIAYTDPELIRSNFTLALERMLEHGSYVGIATHDERLVWESLRLVRKFGLTRDRYEFQMLLGVDAELRKILIDAGHRLRVYVPYGERWYQYSVRRLRENPRIAGHAFRAMFQRG